jgi:hypothetical protein
MSSYNETHETDTTHSEDHTLITENTTTGQGLNNFTYDPERRKD